MEAYYQLTREEREKIVTFILREGLAKLIQHLDAQELPGSREPDEKPE
ncbi:FIG01220305: hypothetical protein [Morganella morganii IS15]|nr:FIG01220305: hypothetical protein [Morganella morganii IS15]